MQRTRIRNIGLVLLGVVFVITFAVYYVLENWTLGRAIERIEGGAVKFSQQSGVYSRAISIKLAADFELPLGSKIYYTLDGDDPTTESTEYTGAINLSPSENKTAVYPVKTAVCYKEECVSGGEQTYVLDKNYKQHVDLDIISITSSKKSLYDWETGIMVEGRTHDEYYKTHELNKNVVKGNFSNRGDEWMRDAHLTMFSTKGEVMLDQDITIGIAGGSSAAYKVKSLKIAAKDGEKILMDLYTAGDVAGYSLVSEYNNLRLRSGSQDHWMTNIRSSVASRLANEAGFDGMTATKRVIVYLNGKFYYIFDVQQTYSYSNIAKKYSLPDTDKVEKYKGTEAAVKMAGVSDLLLADLNVTKNREALEEKVDMDNFLEFYSINILMNNVDWPTNNYEMWHYTGEKDPENKYSDGRYRFLMYDMDMIYCKKGTWSYYRCGLDIFELLMDNDGGYFRNVMQSEYYRDKFLKVIARLLPTTFRTENILKIIDEEKKKVDLAFRQNTSSDKYKQFEEYVGYLKEAARARGEQIRENIKKYFGVDITEVEYKSKSSTNKFSGLVISEMAPKGGADWMRFTNVGDSIISLADYYISDREDKLEMYQLPEMDLKSGESVTINGKNNFYEIGAYICNFNLKEGETLYLSLGEVVVDKMTVPRMDKTETVGRDLETGERLFYYNVHDERRIK